jgi:hypothetical protein
MPNGVSKNIGRLAIVCAAFRAKYGRWPTQARVAPAVLWEYAQLLDDQNFQRLCSRLKLMSTLRAHIAVGDSKAHLVYAELANHPDPQLTVAAHEWLGVRIRPEFEHLD